MAKKYVQKSLDVHVKGHKRSDPRINKKVDVKPYNREQKVKQFIKSTDPVKELYAKTSANEKKVIKMKALTKEEQRLKVVDLNPKIKEWTNICKKCGAENTLWPYFIGKKTVRKCEACGEISTGITKSKWNKLQNQSGLTKEAQELINDLKGEINPNSKRLVNILKNVSPQDRKIILEESKNILKNVSPHDRKIILEEIQNRKIIGAFKELIIEKGEKNPEMLKELLSVDQTGLAFFDKEDQTRIKLLQDFYKNQSKLKESKYYDHNEFTSARMGVITLRDMIKEDTKDRDRAIEIGESKERIKYLDKKLGEKHILLLKAIEKRNRINKLPRGSMADKIAKNKEAELKASNKPTQEKYLYGGIQAHIDKQVEELIPKLKKAKAEGKIYYSAEKEWEILRVNKKTMSIKDKQGNIVKDNLEFVSMKDIKLPKATRKKLEWDSTINYMSSPEAFEEYNKGKYAIYRGKETKAFIEWKKKHEKLR